MDLLMLANEDVLRAILQDTKHRVWKAVDNCIAKPKDKVFVTLEDLRCPKDPVPHPCKRIKPKHGVPPGNK